MSFAENLNNSITFIVTKICVICAGKQCTAMVRNFHRLPASRLRRIPRGNSCTEFFFVLIHICWPSSLWNNCFQQFSLWFILPFKAGIGMLFYRLVGQTLHLRKCNLFPPCYIRFHIRYLLSFKGDPLRRSRDVCYLRVHNTDLFV